MENKERKLKTLIKDVRKARKKHREDENKVNP